MSNTDIVTIEDKTVLQCFSERDGLEDIINDVRHVVESFDHDMSTAASRKKTASLAAKVASFKVKLDGLGKDLVSGWKDKAKKVDANRKAMRDDLDAIKTEARRPLTEYEHEQARIAEEERIKKEQEELEKQKDADHEIAILLNREHDRLKEEERKEAERKRLEQEEQEKKAQEEREKRIAEEAKAQAEREKQKALERERNAIEAAKQSRIEAEEAKKRAEEQAIVAAENARKEEIERQEKEKEKERLAQEKLERNRKHVGLIRKSAKESLIELDDQINEDLAKKIVIAIGNKQIANIHIHY